MPDIGEVMSGTDPPPGSDRRLLASARFAPDELESRFPLIADVRRCSRKPHLDHLSDNAGQAIELEVGKGPQGLTSVDSPHRGIPLKAEAGIRSGISQRHLTAMQE